MLNKEDRRLSLARTAESPRHPSATVAWWMICRTPQEGVEAMTVPCYGGRALALFGHLEEADLFLYCLGSKASEAGWRIRESRCGEVASVLCGPCAGVERVVLDPLPHMIADGTATLVSMDRGRFLTGLLATGNTTRSRARGLRPAASNLFGDGAASRRPGLGKSA